MPTTAKFRVPFNIPTEVTLIAEQLLEDGSCQYLLRHEKQDRILKASKELIELFEQHEIQPGDTFEIVKVATEDTDGFHSRIVVTKKLEEIKGAF